MELEDKVALIHDFSAEFMDYPDDAFKNFFLANNLGIPYSIGVVNQHLKLNSSANEIMEQTWTSLCNLLNINPNEFYDSLSDMLEESDIDFEDEGY
jgi:hypothetical protein